MIFLAVIYFFVKWLSRIHKGKSGRKNVTSVTWLQEDFVLSVFTKYLIDAACDHVKNPQHGNCDQQISDAPGQVGNPVGIVLWTENLQCSCQKCRKICNVRAKNAEKFAMFVPKMQKNLQYSCQKCRKFCFATVYFYEYISCILLDKWKSCRTWFRNFIWQQNSAGGG